MIPYYRKYKQAKSISDLKPNKPMLSWLPNKKMVVLAKKGNQTKVVHFGDKAYADYTMHNDKTRRKSYLARAKGIKDKNGNLTWKDKLSANYWAVKILW